MKGAAHFLGRHYVLITMLLGSIIIVLWTLLRFWTDKSIFDLVGQQLLTRTFLEDGSMDATVGATHYIAKMFLVYAPFDFLGLDPRLSLVLLTLLINVGTYIGILFAIRSILRSLKFLKPKTFAIGMLWLASTAGSVFWIEFANSRNIEVVAGLGVIALGLRYIHRPSILVASIWLLLMILTFFMDPLQIYMTGIPLLVYIVITEIRMSLKDNPLVIFQKLATIVVIFGLGYILAAILLALIESISGIHVIDDGSSMTSLTMLMGQLREAAIGAVSANIRTFSGYVDDGGRIRQLISLLGIIFALGAWIFFVIRKKIKGTAVLFVCIFLVTIQGVYFASGQSLNGDTSRYLIMAAPIMVIVIAMLPKAKITDYVVAALSFAVVVNCILLIGATINAYPSRFAQDKPLREVANIVTEKNGGNIRFYASMDTALPTMFYYPQVKILPLSCTSNILARAETFYPKRSYDQYQKREVKFSAIILEPGDYISNYPSVCDYSDIVKQFGEPSYKEEPRIGRTILYYRPDILKF